MRCLCLRCFAARISLCGLRQGVQLMIGSSPKGYQRITEPYGTGFILQGNAWLFSTGGHDYMFSERMTQAQCIEFAARQEQLCAYLADQGLDTAGLAFYVLPGYPNRSDSDNHAAYLDCTAQQS